ncbi:MAG TPA: VOC family protein [Ruminiclostridium sp.]
MGINTDGICQIALVVSNIEDTVKQYEKAFGLKDLKIEFLPETKNIPAYFKGQLGDFSGCRICAFKLGSVALEMIEPDEKPSPWREFLDTHGQGVQHIGFLVDDKYEALKTLEDEGCKPFHVGYFPNMTYVFVDTLSKFGVDFNIKQANEHNEEKIAKLLSKPNESITSI